MFCKRCGHNIPPSEKACPNCGQTVATAGGGSLRDLVSTLEGKEPPRPAEGASSRPGGPTTSRVPPHAHNEYARYDHFHDLPDHTHPYYAYQEHGHAKWPIILCALLCVVALALSAFAFSGGKKAEKANEAVETLRRDLNQQEKAIKELQEGDLPEIKERIEMLEENAKTEEGFPYSDDPDAGEVKKPVINDAPTTKTKTIEQFNKSSTVFTIGTAEEAEFVWQRLNDKEEWVDLFTKNSNVNPTYGLRVQKGMDDKSKTESWICPNNMTEKAQGTYRCIVRNEEGGEVECEPVQIVILPSETTSTTQFTPPPAIPSTEPSWGASPDDEDVGDSMNTVITNGTFFGRQNNG